MKRDSAPIKSTKRKKWKPFVATLCVSALLVALAAGCRNKQPMAPDGGGGDSPGVTTGSTAATTATIKNEPLATTTTTVDETNATGDEMTGAATTTVNTSSADKTDATTQRSSASATKATTPSKPSSSTRQSKPTHNIDLSGMEYINGEYLDKSDLTFTQADVGKIVGYSPGMERDIIVCSVDETPTADGRRAVCLLLGYRGIEDFNYSPSGFSIVECEYCHEFPCPEDGDKNCPKYDPLIDASVTCQDCGLPLGNGYYGTCDAHIDWENGAATICNHYSNCLKCGRPVGDGYNGTCHVTWDIYPGKTTCNHYD